MTSDSYAIPHIERVKTWKMCTKFSTKLTIHLNSLQTRTRVLAEPRPQSQDQLLSKTSSPNPAYLCFLSRFHLSSGACHVCELYSSVYIRRVCGPVVFPHSQTFLPCGKVNFTSVFGLTSYQRRVVRLSGELSSSK